MRVALLTSCGQIGNSFGMLGEHLGRADEPHHRRWSKCSTNTDSIRLAQEVRGLVNGSLKVVVGINRDDHQATMRTLQVATRTHQCVVVMTLEGFRGFADFVDAMSASDRSLFGSRICGAILVGDQRDCFHNVEKYVSTGKVRHIGGVTWSPETCAGIADFIRGDP